MHHPAGTLLVCAVEGIEPSPAEARFFRAAAPSGLTLFSRNIPPEQAAVSGLVRSLQGFRPAGAPPLVVAIDQEGGRVARLKAPFPNAGPAMHLAKGGADEASCREITRVATDMAQRLLALGINVNFAPVCDVLTEESNHAIGDRAFATEVSAASARAGAFLAGLTAGGVLGCLKHFPGQGAARVDTHLGGAAIDLSAEELELHLQPFRALLPQAAMVMISHCIYPAWAKREASLSPEIMTKLLRQRLGFDGVVVSDDMNMEAVPQQASSWQQAIVEAVLAGADMILVCRHLERCELAHEALVKEAEVSPAFARRLQAAAERVLGLRGKLRV